MPSALDMLSRFLVYPPESRMKARDALLHPWFHGGVPILLAGDYQVLDDFKAHYEKSWQSEDLGYWLNSMIRKP